jgi:hypothetical protein
MTRRVSGPSSTTLLVHEIWCTPLLKPGESMLWLLPSQQMTLPHLISNSTLSLRLNFGLPRLDLRSSPFYSKLPSPASSMWTVDFQMSSSSQFHFPGLSCSLAQRTIRLNDSMTPRRFTLWPRLSLKSSNMPCVAQLPLLLTSRANVCNPCGASCCHNHFACMPSIQTMRYGSFYSDPITSVGPLRSFLLSKANSFSTCRVHTQSLRSSSPISRLRTSRSQPLPPPLRPAPPEYSFLVFHPRQASCAGATF